MRIVIPGLLILAAITACVLIGAFAASRAQAAANPGDTPVIEAPTAAPSANELRAGCIVPTAEEVADAFAASDQAFEAVEVAENRGATDEELLQLLDIANGALDRALGLTATLNEGLACLLRKLESI
jgi:hypothetical protein